jgi:threonine aldolase
MRFISAQFEALLTNELWLRNARTANGRARILAEKLAAIPGVRITHPVESNAVFAKIPANAVKSLLERNYFYVWDEENSEVRLMTSFDTKEEDIEAFALDIRQTLERLGS